MTDLNCPSATRRDSIVQVHSRGAESMRLLLNCCILVLLGISAAWSEDDLELIKAKATYEDVVAKQKDLLKTAFEREVIKVARTGKLNLVEEIKLEQTEFLESGELPESAGMKTHVQKYRRPSKRRGSASNRPTRKRVIALTKAAKLDEAKAAQSELKKILSGSTEDSGPSARNRSTNRFSESTRRR